MKGDDARLELAALERARAGWVSVPSADAIFLLGLGQLDFKWRFWLRCVRARVGKHPLRRARAYSGSVPSQISDWVQPGLTGDTLKDTPIALGHVY